MLSQDGLSGNNVLNSSCTSPNEIEISLLVPANSFGSTRGRSGYIFCNAYKKFTLSTFSNKLSLNYSN